MVVTAPLPNLAVPVVVDPSAAVVAAASIAVVAVPTVVVPIVGASTRFVEVSAAVAMLPQRHARRGPCDHCASGDPRGAH